MKLKSLQGLQFLQIALLLIILLNNSVLHLSYLNTILTFLVLGCICYQLIDSRYKPLFITENETQGSKVNSEATIFAEQLRQTIDDEVIMINTQIQQVNDLVKSASLAIYDSFTRLSELSSGKHEILLLSITDLTEKLKIACNQLNNDEKDTEQSDKPNSEQFSKLNGTSFKQNYNQMIDIVSQLQGLTEHESQELSKISTQLNDATVTGVRALQFEDLTYQVLMSIEQNIQIVSELSDYIPLFLHYLSTNNHTELTLLKQKIIEINVTSKHRNNSKQVMQTSMNEGDVELF